MSYASKNAEILALFVAAGKDIPHEDSDMGRAVQILQTICDSQSHVIPVVDEEVAYLDDSCSEVQDSAYEFFEALEEIESHIGEDDFTLDFDGNEYRIINESDIWEIYKDVIQNIVEDCYSDVIHLDKVPSFIAVSIDWEQTAKNAYVDGYAHTFSTYCGDMEEESAGYYVFRTN